jgi:hypothetical protein
MSGLRFGSGTSPCAIARALRGTFRVPLRDPLSAADGTLDETAPCRRKQQRAALPSALSVLVRCGSVLERVARSHSCRRGGECPGRDNHSDAPALQGAVPHGPQIAKVRPALA